jgi:hypothetical protein
MERACRRYFASPPALQRRSIVARDLPVKTQSMTMMGVVTNGMSLPAHSLRRSPPVAGSS